MKAELSGNAITLQNGVKFLATKGETEGDFIERVTEVVDRDYCDELVVAPGAEPYWSSKLEAPLFKTEPEPEPEPDQDSIPAEVFEEGNCYDNIGKTCSFPTQKTKETVVGQIIWIYHDKRKDLLYYRVKDARGKLHIKRTNAKTLTIHENS